MGFTRRLFASGKGRFKFWSRTPVRTLIRPRSLGVKGLFDENIGLGGFEMLVLDREKYWMTGKDASLPFPVKRIGLAANGTVGDGLRALRLFGVNDRNP
jgi:hypothetical protein